MYGEGFQQQIEEAELDTETDLDPVVLMTARSDIKPRPRSSQSGRSVNTENASGGGGGGLQERQSEVQQLADLHPALIKWLNQQDTLFQFAESKTGLEREKIFYGLCVVLALYLMVGPGAGFLCNLLGFVYPARRSLIAVRSGNKEDDTQLLVFWSMFGCCSVLDCFAEQIIQVFPIYWLIKLCFLLYLALPQTNGAHTLYVNYVIPAFEKLNDPLGRIGLI